MTEDPDKKKDAREVVIDVAAKLIALMIGLVVGALLAVWVIALYWGVRWLWAALPWP